MNLLENTHDFAQVSAFYKYAIENDPKTRELARWKYGHHPTDELLQDYIDSDSMFVVRENGKIIAAVALTMWQDDDYCEGKWEIDVSDTDVATLHLFCVDKSRQGTGLGKYLMAEMEEMARNAGKKAFRLCAVARNIPAQRFYEKLGFTGGHGTVWFPVQGVPDEFIYYEKLL